MQKKKVKNLFKNKIPFYSLRKECINRYEFSTNSTLNIVYKTNTIEDPIELGISNFEDLMDKVNPFIYYLASKYQNVIEWNYEYKIFFDVIIAFPREEYKKILTDYILNKYHNELSIDITEQEDFLHDCTEEDIKELICTSFHIIISVRAEYINRLYEDEEDESEDESEDEPEEEDEEEKEPIKLKQTIIYDKCVICLENKANILYPKCLHISTCKRCEELHPIFKCPICREEVMIKYII